MQDAGKFPPQLHVESETVREPPLFHIHRPTSKYEYNRRGESRHKRQSAPIVIHRSEWARADVWTSVDSHIYQVSQWYGALAWTGKPTSAKIKEAPPQHEQGAPDNSETVQTVESTVFLILHDMFDQS